MDKSFHPTQKWYQELPNRLTLARMCVIPFLLVVHPWNFTFTRVICALVFLAAAITDFLDGYLARKYKSVSTLGALLDPVADKMLAAAGLIVLVKSDAIWPWMAGLILCRDIAISGLRLVALEKNFTIKVSTFGKLKTAAEDVAIFCLLINENLMDIPFRNVGIIAMWVTLALSLYSGYLYSMEFWHRTKNENFEESQL